MWNPFRPKPIEVGSRWSLESDNPFGSKSIITITDVKGRWVEYRYTAGSMKFSMPAKELRYWWWKRVQ